MFPCFSIKHILNIKWTVASVRDIADFLVYIRDAKNKVLFEQYIAYSEREIEIPLSNITDTAISDVEVCILSKSSDSMELNRWFDNQCHPLPGDFRTAGNKFVLHGEPVYKIFSSQKQRTPSRSGNVASSTPRTINQSAALLILISIMRYAF